MEHSRWGYEQHGIIQHNTLHFFLYVHVDVYYPISSPQGDIYLVPDYYFEVIKWWLRLKSYDNRIAKKSILIWTMQLAEEI